MELCYNGYCFTLYTLYAHTHNTCSFFFLFQSILEDGDLGPMAQRKKSMIKDGKLDKHGKPNSNTPSDFLQSYKDFSKTKAPELVGACGFETSCCLRQSRAMVVEETVVVAAVVDKKREADDDEQDETPRKKEKKEKKKKKDKKKKKEKE